MTKQPHQLKRVLAINFGGIGDEILFLPTLKSIRAQLPNCHLSLMLEPRSASVRQITELVDDVITFDIKKRPLLVADLLELLNKIREGAFDILVSSGSSKQVAILLFLSGVPERVGYDSGSLSRRLLTYAVPLDRNQYAACMYHDLATGLGAPKLDVSECIPELTIPESSRVLMRQWLQRPDADFSSDSVGTDRQKKRVLLHPGTSKLAIQKGIIKTWEADSWMRLIKLLLADGDKEVILAGGPDDAEIVRSILPPGSEAEHPLLRSGVGITRNLSDLAALIEMTDLLVCVDSAPMHIGVGLRKPLVAMFGPTDERKLLPADPRFKALRESTHSQESSPQLSNGVRLQPDIVFQSVLDQLKAAAVQESYPELAR